MYKVVIKKSAIKGVEKMPKIAQLAIGNLVEGYWLHVLNGPYQRSFLQI
jgi:hypothetical protein